MTYEDLERENDELRRRLAEAEETLAAIRQGQVDAIVVDDAAGTRIFSLSGAETVYRLAVETMADAALNVAPDGTILFCNARFGRFVATPIERLIGQDLADFVAPEQRAQLRELLRAGMHEPVAARVVFCGPGQQRTPARLSGSPLSQPGGVSLCLLATDLTELESSAHQIERLRQVQDELRESRRAALEIMHDALEARMLAERSAEALRRHAETFTNLVEQSPLGIYTIDSRFRVCNVSAGARPVFRNVQPLIGRDFAEVMHIVWPEPFASEAIGIFRHTLATGEPYVSPGLTERRHDTAAIESYEWQVNRVVLADGQHGVVCYFFDATRLEQAHQAIRESEARFRALTHATSDVVYRMNADWTEMRHLQGRDFVADPLEPTLGWVDQYVHPDDQRDVLATIERAIRTRSVFEMEHRMVRVDGSLGWTHSRAIPILDEAGRIVEWFGAASDVTQRKQAEIALKEADRHKDEFLAMLAHELRNPLAPIRTSVALLRSRELADPLLARARDIIDRQVAQMARLLDDLLDVSRLSRGKLTLQPAPTVLRDALGAAIEANLPLIEQREQELSVEGLEQPIVLTADLTRLTQVFGNLLNNASKYSPPRAHIHLAVALEGGEAVVRVSDTGAGIAAEMLPSVFDLFTQAETSQRLAPGGLGIGLALARRLTELHGGSVTAASEGVGRGSTFTVRLPARAAARAVEAPASTRAQASGATRLERRVLVADDNADAADTIASLLGELACDVRTVYGGEAALHEAERFRPDVALLDLGMPDLDGREVCRRIRSQPWGAAIEIVALTGWGREDDRQGTRAAGFDHHLVKPVDPELLVQLVERVERGAAA